MNADWCCFVAKSNWPNSHKQIGAVSILVGWVKLFVQFPLHCLDNMHLECCVLFAVGDGHWAVFCVHQDSLFTVFYNSLQYFTVFYSILQYL